MDAVLDAGAVLKELGWLENDLAQAWNFKGMLDTGWSPYERATHFQNVKKGESIPGAISALTMNVLLFHAQNLQPQANRDGHLLEPKNHHHTAPPALNEFKIQMYQYGGNPS